LIIEGVTALDLALGLGFTVYVGQLVYGPQVPGRPRTPPLTSADLPGFASPQQLNLDLENVYIYPPTALPDSTVLIFPGNALPPVLTRCPGFSDTTALGQLVSNIYLTQGQDDKQEFKKPKPGATGKAGATNIASWAKDKGMKPRVGQSGKDFAKDCMDAQYGKGGWSRSGKQGKEFSELKKYADRHFK